MFLRKKRQNWLRRAQFNTLIDPTTGEAVRELAKELGIPIYAAVEFFIEAGLKGVARWRESDVAMARLRDHIVRHHVLRRG